MSITLSGCASTRVYVRGADDGWILLRSYLGFSYVCTGSDECIYDTSIIKVVDIPVDTYLDLRAISLFEWL